MARGYLREPTELQYEWSFPFNYKGYSWCESSSRPEAVAISKVLEREKPLLLYGLHHCGFYEGYFYFSRDMPQLYPVLRKLVYELRIPLAESAPDVPFGVSFSTGFYKMYGVRDYIDYYEKKDPSYLKHLRRGACSDEYYATLMEGRPHFSMNCEMPMFHSTKLRDKTPSGKELKKVMGERLARHTAAVSFAKNIMNALSSYSTHCDEFLFLNGKLHIENALHELEHEKKMLETAEDRIATNAEVFDAGPISELMDMFFLGQVWRIAECISLHIPSESISKLKDSLELELVSKAKSIKNTGGFYQIPIKSCIKVQLGSLFHVMKALEEEGKAHPAILSQPGPPEGVPYKW